MTDVFAYYFPQFYETAENSEWWGEGFTDWRLVKNAIPLYPGHHQPRVPAMGFLNQSEHSTLKKQINLANEYAITGFNIYHYWFNGKVHLGNPAEIILNDKSLDIKMMFTWANESWTRQWIGKPNDFLIKQKYYSSELDIKEHYNYLSSFFKDERYYKVDNKPVFSIYRPELIPDLSAFIDLINKLAIEDGFSGVYFLACRSYNLVDAYRYYCKFDGIINFNPRFAINTSLKKTKLGFLESIARKFPEFLQAYLSAKINSTNKIKIYSYYDYLNSMSQAENFFNGVPVYHSVFPDWDNTARYKDNATLFKDANVDLYKSALQISYNGLTKEHKKMMFINAWNEWSEGAYLEPDIKSGLSYLQATRKIHDFL